MVGQQFQYSPYWTEDADPWQLHFPGKGICCPNWTKGRGVRVGESVCEWALSPGFDYYDPYCRPPLQSQGGITTHYLSWE